jgi:acetyltransferase-like isoleucine patch superfamily enzyme
LAKHIEKSADIEDGVTLEDNCKIWHHVHIREFAQIGENSIIGRGAYVGPGVKVGNNTKIQNYAQIFDPAEIGDGVFIGPGVILTNDIYPRAVSPEGSSKLNKDWTPQGVTVQTGASVGAGSVILAGVTIGEWALVGAGSVVIRDVPSFALVVGNPSKQIGWVGREGIRLVSDGETLVCPQSGDRFIEHSKGIQFIE